MCLLYFSWSWSYTLCTGGHFKPAPFLTKKYYRILLDRTDKLHVQYGCYRSTIVVHCMNTIHVRDTTDFLQKLREIPLQPSESLLISLNASSLYGYMYTKILHDEGIKVCEELLNNRPHQSPPTKDPTRIYAN